VTTAKAQRLVRARAMTASGEAREVRKRSRLSLADVGRTVGVDTSTVARWERGERVPRGDAAWRYADLLDRLSRAASAQQTPR
jgi:DNA-binding transcriptional regulator YiaG